MMPRWCDVIGVTAESPTSWLVYHWYRLDLSMTYVLLSASARSTTVFRQLSPASPFDIIHKLHNLRQIKQFQSPDKMIVNSTNRAMTFVMYLDSNQLIQQQGHDIPTSSANSQSHNIPIVNLFYPYTKYIRAMAFQMSTGKKQGHDLPIVDPPL